MLLQTDPGFLHRALQVHEAASREEVLERDVVVVGAVSTLILPEVPDRASTRHDAARRRHVAREHLEQAGLAGPVPTHDPDLVPGGEGQVQSVDDRPSARFDREAERLEGVHRRAPTWRGTGDVSEANIGFLLDRDIGRSGAIAPEMVPRRSR
jgi:hypothetical protein